MKTGSGSQFSDSRGRKSPRSSSRIFFPVGASVWASVPPPAPVPMMMTSYRSVIVLPPVDTGRVRTVQDLRRPGLAEVVPRPAHEGVHPLPDAAHQPDVDAEPRRERDRPVQLVAMLTHLGDGRVAADHRHDALVVVVERL